MNDKNSLAERFRYAREEAGMNKADMARALGFHRSAVTNIESGKTKSLPPPTQSKITAITGISGAWVATGHGPMRASEIDPRDCKDADRIARLQIKLLALDPATRSMALELLEAYLASRQED